MTSDERVVKENQALLKRLETQPRKYLRFYGDAKTYISAKRKLKKFNEELGGRI